MCSLGACWCKAKVSRFTSRVAFARQLTALPHQLGVHGGKAMPLAMFDLVKYAVPGRTWQFMQ